MNYVISASLLLVATTALAQTPSPSASDRDRWAPWMGCWQIADESVEDVQKLLAMLSPTLSATNASAGRVCVTPSTDGGATMNTIVGGKTVHTETIVADGQSRPLTDPNCKGSQLAEWSKLGPRIYARSDVSCGNQPTRNISGFSAVVSGPMWIDVQMVESQGRKSMRVRRYRRAPDQTGAAPSTTQLLGTMPLGGKLSLAEIAEASAKLAPETLQAVVMELGAGGYDLNAKRLVELDEAGVPGSVIDLMVAMSFPKKFVVERAVARGGPGGFADDFDTGLWGPFSMWSPLSMWGYYAHPRYYSSYYSPFGYYNWGYYDPYTYGYPGLVILNPGGGSGSPEPTGAGRVVDGFGYTRIRPNNPDPAPRTGDGGSGGSSSGSSAGSNSGSSSGGSVSTGGYSGGGGGGGGVAVPRPPGGY